MSENDVVAEVVGEEAADEGALDSALEQAGEDLIDPETEPEDLAPDEGGEVLQNDEPSSARGDDGSAPSEGPARSDSSAGAASSLAKDQGQADNGTAQPSASPSPGGGSTPSPPSGPSNPSLPDPPVISAVPPATESEPEPSPEPSPTPTPTPTPAPRDESDPAPTPAPRDESDPAPTPEQVAGCGPAIPSGPTLFGSMISTKTLTAEQSVAEVDRHFGRTPVVRIFDPGLPSNWDKSQWTATRGRTLVTSFRPPIDEVLAGTHDSYLRRWFANAPTDQTIYWSYIHEPDAKDGLNRDQYKRAWKRIADLADEACKSNMIPTLILTSWTADPSSGRSLADFDPGKDVVDVIAWDPYNGAGAGNDRDYYASPEDVFGDVVRVSKADGRPWGIAETGAEVVPQDGGQSGRAKWLTGSANFIKQHDPLFASYFHADSRYGDWKLDDSTSQDAWGAFIK